MKRKATPVISVKIVPLTKDREAGFNRALEVLMRLGKQRKSKRNTVPVS